MMERASQLRMQKMATHLSTTASINTLLRAPLSIGATLNRSLESCDEELEKDVI
jgi:hypothetical protein